MYTNFYQTTPNHPPTVPSTELCSGAELDKIVNLCYSLYTFVYTNLCFNRLTNHRNPKNSSESLFPKLPGFFGVNSQTIRRAITAQEITYAIVGGRYKINFESLVKWSQHHTTVRNKLAKRGIGQFVDKWKIKNPLYSPNPKVLNTKEKELKLSTEEKQTTK